MPVKYKHTQVGYTIIAVFFGVIVLIDVLMLLFGFATLGILMVVVLLLVGILFATLTIELNNGLLRASFGPGLIRKTVRLDEVVACKTVTNPWYYGWGIRLTPRGWLYNVSGLQAVELTLKNGRVIQFGTDQPDRLCEAIQSWL